MSDPAGLAVTAVAVLGPYLAAGGAEAATHEQDDRRERGEAGGQVQRHGPRAVGEAGLQARRGDEEGQQRGRGDQPVAGAAVTLISGPVDIAPPLGVTLVKVETARDMMARIARELPQVRIDGVTDGKPAAKAGLKAGDVVVKLGEHRITDMMSYMKGLGKFTKGEQTVVTVLRNGKEEKVNVTW